MKLELLTESQADWSFLKDIFTDAAKYNEIVRVFSILTKGFKFVKSEVKENQGVTKGWFFFFTNTLIDLDLYVNANRTKDKDNNDAQYMMVNITAKVHDRYLISVKDDMQKNLIQTMEFVDDDISKFANSAEKAQKVINKFIDWYFNISGEYGKIKLFGTTYNVIDGYSRGGENRFIAIAGDFHCETDLSKDEVEERVF